MLVIQMVASYIMLLYTYTVSSLKGVTINSHESTHNNQLNQFYSFSVSIYILRTLAVYKMNGRGFSNTVCCKRLPKKTKKGDAVRGSILTTEQDRTFSYT